MSRTGHDVFTAVNEEKRSGIVAEQSQKGKEPCHPHEQEEADDGLDRDQEPAGSIEADAAAVNRVYRYVIIIRQSSLFIN